MQWFDWLRSLTLEPPVTNGPYYERLKLDYALIRSELAKELPRAASMIPSEFVSLGLGTGDNNDELASSKSLTYALMTLTWDPPDPEIRFEPDGFTPDGINKHVLRKGLATFIHEENVQRIDLRLVEDGRALGTVFFVVPRMAQGQVHFQSLKDKAGRCDSKSSSSGLRSSASFPVPR